MLSGESSTVEKLEVGAGAMAVAAAAVLARSAAFRLMPAATKGLESLPNLELSAVKNPVASEAFASTPSAVRDLAAQSMSPRAFKVLAGDHSLYDPQFKYPLPKLGKDGQWVPGDWVTPGHSEGIGNIQSAIHGRTNQKAGLFISDKPQLWKAGASGHTTYEVEIGDVASKNEWSNGVIRSDFVAQKIRLLRPLGDDEIRSLPPPTIFDRLGGIPSAPSQSFDMLKKESQFVSSVAKDIEKDRKTLGASPDAFAIVSNMSPAERLVHLRKMVLGLER